MRRRETPCRQSLADLASTFADRPVVFPAPAGWARSNPTLAHGAGGLAAVVRSGNYSVDLESAPDFPAFLHQCGREFAAGLARTGGDLQLTFGGQDREA